MAEINVGVKLTAEGGPQVEEALRKVATSAESFSKKTGTLISSLKKLGAAFGVYLGARQLVSFFMDSARAAIEESRSMDLLSGSIKKVGLSKEKAIPITKEFAETMVNLGRESSETNTAMARLLARTGDLDKAMAMTKLASDLAASGLGDYTNNAELLAKVLIGRGTRAMIQWGIAVKEGATITEQLAAIQNRVTITTEQFASTTEGQIQVARIQWNELKQDLGAFGAITLVNLANAFTKTYNKIGQDTDSFIKQLAEFFNFTLPNAGDILMYKLLDMIGKIDTHFLKILEKWGLGSSKFTEWIRKGAEENEEFLRILGKKLLENSNKFEDSWKNLKEGADIGVGGLIDAFDELDTKTQDVFGDMAKNIVSSIAKQTDKIKELKNELKSLSEETDEQLKKSEDAYQGNLKTMARNAQERIGQIDKEINETRDRMEQGWRGKITELEKERGKEKTIIARIGGEVSDIQTEALKDDLIVLQEAHKKEMEEIKEQGRKKELETQRQILEMEVGRLKGAIAITTPGALGKMAEVEAKLKPWEISPYQNTYNFNFEGEGWDEDSIMKMIIDALNRASTLKQYGGQ